MMPGYTGVKTEHENRGDKATQEAVDETQKALETALTTGDMQAIASAQKASAVAKAAYRNSDKGTREALDEIENEIREAVLDGDVQAIAAARRAMADAKVQMRNHRLHKKDGETHVDDEALEEINVDELMEAGQWQSKKLSKAATGCVLCVCSTCLPLPFT